MKKLCLLLVVAVVLVLALALASPAVAKAAGSVAVSGDWRWEGWGTETEMPGGIIVVDATEVGTWTGSFVGTSLDYYQVTSLPPFLETEWGPIWGVLTATFRGRVAGRYGTMTMFFTIWAPANDPVGRGTWKVLSGTQALRYATGNGTWASDGVGPHATYEGTISFTPGSHRAARGHGAALGPSGRLPRRG